MYQRVLFASCALVMALPARADDGAGSMAVWPILLLLGLTGLAFVGLSVHERQRERRGLRPVILRSRYKRYTRP